MSSQPEDQKDLVVVVNGNNQAIVVALSIPIPEEPDVSSDPEMIAPRETEVPLTFSRRADDSLTHFLRG
jgi:hypothetical protein